MNVSGQSALEYLMTYGWALLVIAIVVGVLIFVTSSGTGGVSCLSQSTDIGLSNYSVTKDRVQLSLQNRSGAKITGVAAVDGGTFSPITDFTVTPTSVDNGTTFTVDSGANDGPGSLGSFTNGAVKVTFTKTGLPGAIDGNVICSGTL